MLVAEVIVNALAVYLLVGLVFGAAFVLAGVGRVDPVARGASAAFRLLILPGAVALWPALALKWLRASRRGGNS